VPPAARSSAPTTSSRPESSSSSQAGTSQATPAKPPPRRARPACNRVSGNPNSSCPAEIDPAAEAGERAAGLHPTAAGRGRGLDAAQWPVGGGELVHRQFGRAVESAPGPVQPGLEKQAARKGRKGIEPLRRPVECAEQLSDGGERLLQGRGVDPQFEAARPCHAHAPGGLQLETGGPGTPLLDDQLAVVEAGRHLGVEHVVGGPGEGHAVGRKVEAATHRLRVEVVQRRDAQLAVEACAAAELGQRLHGQGIIEHGGHGVDPVVHRLQAGNVDTTGQRAGPVQGQDAAALDPRPRAVERQGPDLGRAPGHLGHGLDGHGEARGAGEDEVAGLQGQCAAERREVEGRAAQRRAGLVRTGGAGPGFGEEPLPQGLRIIRQTAQLGGERRQAGQRGGEFPRHPGTENPTLEITDAQPAAFQRQFAGQVLAGHRQHGQARGPDIRRHPDFSAPALDGSLGLHPAIELEIGQCRRRDLAG